MLGGVLCYAAGRSVWAWRSPLGTLGVCVWACVVPAPPTQIDFEASFVANIKSQIKRNKQNEKARLRNKAVKSELKTEIRKFREAVESGDVEATAAQLRIASRKLDKAASKGVIHKNQAANRKSAIAKSAAELQAK
jgi:small subunit ribosomal protein S20